MSEESIVEKLPLRFRQAVLQAGIVGLEEIRFRIGQPLELDYEDRRIQLRVRQEYGSSCVTEADMRELLNYLTGYSLYAYEDEIRQGYFTIPGGHRIGVAGRTSTSYSRGSRTGIGCGCLSDRSENSLGYRISGVDAAQQVAGIVDIASVNIRVAHEHRGCAKSLMPYIRRDTYIERDERKKKRNNTGNRLENCDRREHRNYIGAWNKNDVQNEAADIYNTLILAPPGVGKTTYLRDCIRMLSDGERAHPMKVAVVDERSEIAACYRGVPQNDVGSHTDVLDGCPKLQGMRMLLRSMSPQVIAVDELGGEEDFLALYELMHSGIRVLGTVHAGSVEELQSKPYLQQLLGRGRIERLILLRKDGNGQRACSVYDTSENDMVELSSQKGKSIV